ncbi:hypothetical protein [Pseudarthrobacter sp. MEB009]|uniref:hypothetical protein n=1 Tax=Pseudarthrobacter sp. MEB009 TaxID=3040326 RepID=UPI0025559CB3|nr:hypothetical protein [Pseudarthrobacter sp. MEB009]
MPTIIKEARSAVTLNGSRTEITLITPGWGSSGYYSREMLEQAAKDRVFPAKTQQHIDHDGDGGVGSVATLAAALAEDARWEPDWVDPDNPGEEPGRLVAENRVFSHKREMLAEIKDVIGTSIAAAAEISYGEANGRKGQIIERLIPAVTNRVDYVTHAGRGGRISEVLEAAKVKEARNVGMWLEARMHSMFTNISDEMFGDGRLTREERITLSSALGDALTSFTANVEANAPQLFQRDLWEDPTPTAAEEAAPTDSAPNPAAVTENQGDATMATIDDKELAALRESASRATTAEAELKKEREERALESAQSRKGQAASIVREAFGEDAPAFITESAQLMAAAENFDPKKLTDSVTEAAAKFQSQAGAGRPAGNGAQPITESRTHSDEDTINALEGGK